MDKIALLISFFYLIKSISTHDFSSHQEQCVRWFPEFSHDSLQTILTGYQRVLKYMEDDVADEMKKDIQDYIADSLHKNAGMTRMSWIVFKYKNGLRNLCFVFLMCMLMKVTIVYMACRITKMREFQPVLRFLKHQAARVFLTVVPVYAFIFLVYYVSRINIHTEQINRGIYHQQEFLAQIKRDYDAMSQAHMSQMKCMARQQLRLLLRGEALSSEMLTYSLNMKEPLTTKLTGSMIFQDGVLHIFKVCDNMITRKVPHKFDLILEKAFQLDVKKYIKYFKTNYRIFDAQLSRDIEASFDRAQPVFTLALSSMAELIRSYNDDVLAIPARHFHSFDYFLLVMIFITFTSLFVLGGMTLLRIRLKNRYKLWAVRSVPYCLSVFIVIIYSFTIMTFLHIFGIAYVKKIAVEQDYKAFNTIPNQTIALKGFKLSFSNGHILSKAEKMNSTILDIFDIIDPTHSLFKIYRHFEKFTDDNLLNTVHTGLKYFLVPISRFEFVKNKTFTDLPIHCREIEQLSTTAKSLLKTLPTDNSMNKRFYDYVNQILFKNRAVQMSPDDLYTQNARIFLDHIQAYSVNVNRFFLDPVVEFVIKLVQMVLIHLFLILYTVVAVAMLENEERNGHKSIESDSKESDEEK